jgi:hypothetical protein
LGPAKLSRNFGELPIPPMAIQPLKIPIRSYGENIPVAPDTNAEVNKINELVDAVNAGLATSNAIVGGPKYVQYLSSQTYGVPADASTLDRLSPESILPGNEATVINPHPNPLTNTALSAYYRATIAPAGTAGAVMVPAFTGSPDTVPIVWVEVVDNSSFTPLLANELNPGKAAYANLTLRPLLIALVNGVGTGSTTVISTPATTQPATGPTVTGFLPGSAAVEASVTLTGTGFAKATAVLFNGTPASFQIVNVSTIVAVVPVGATTGPVAVTNSAGTGTSAANFEVKATVVVTPADTTPPTVAFTVPAAGATLAPNTQVLLTVIANDNVAVQGLTFTNGVTGAVIGPGAKNGSTYTFPYTTPATTGPLSLVATATDAAGNSQPATVNVTVGSTTPTPTPTADLTAALAISLATLTLGAPVAYSITPAGGTSPYAYEVVATDTATGQQFTLGTTRTGSWIPTAVGSYAIEADVTDSSNPVKAAQSATRYLQVVAAANRIPVADAGQDVTLPAGTKSLVLMGTASDPDAGDTLTYVWRQITGPNNATGIPATTLNVVASNLVAGTYQFGFRSTDNHGAQSVEDFMLVTVPAASTGVPNADDYAVLVAGDSTTTNDYSPFSPTLIPVLNRGISNNGYIGSFTSAANTGISGMSLIANPDGSDGGLIGRFNELVAGRYVAGKYNVIVVQCLLNSLAGEVYLRGESGAAERVLAQLKHLIALIRADNPNWCILISTCTPRTNGVQPGQENQRPILNQSIRDGWATGSLDVQAVAQFGFDTRLSIPGPDINGNPTTLYKDWVHYSQQALDAIVCPSIRDAFLYARFRKPQPAPYTGAPLSDLYLAGAQVPPVKSKSVGVGETAVGSGVYNVPWGGPYGDWSRSIVFGATMPAQGKSRVLIKKAALDSLNAILGVSASASLATTANAFDAYNAWLYQHEDGRVLGREGPGSGEGVDLGGRLDISEYLSLDKNDRVLSVSKTSDGVNFITFYTFPGSYPMALTIHMALEASLGKAYAPQGFGLTLTPNPAPVLYNGPITFADNIDQVVTSGNISAPNHAAGSWGAIGLCTSHQLRVGSRLIMDFSPSAAGFAMLGVSSKRVKVGYADPDFSAGIWAVNYQGRAYLHRIAYGADSLLFDYAPDGRMWSLFVGPAGMSAEYSLNNGTNWTSVGILPFVFGDYGAIISDINQMGSLLQLRGTELVPV